LNPDIEQSNREGERAVDRHWAVQDITQMVQLGIMSVPTAQEVLGLDQAREASQAGAQTARAGAVDLVWALIQVVRH